MKPYQKAFPSEQFFVEWHCGDVTIDQIEDGTKIDSTVRLKKVYTFFKVSPAKFCKIFSGDFHTYG